MRNPHVPAGAVLLCVPGTGGQRLGRPRRRVRPTSRHSSERDRRFCACNRAHGAGGGCGALSPRRIWPTGAKRTRFRMSTSSSNGYTLEMATLWGHAIRASADLSERIGVLPSLSFNAGCAVSRPHGVDRLRSSARDRQRRRLRQRLMCTTGSGCSVTRPRSGARRLPRSGAGHHRLHATSLIASSPVLLGAHSHACAFPLGHQGRRCPLLQSHPERPAWVPHHGSPNLGRERLARPP